MLAGRPPHAQLRRWPHVAVLQAPLACRRRQPAACLAHAQVLRRLYASIFCLGPGAAVGDLVRYILRVPSPAMARRQVCTCAVHM